MKQTLRISALALLLLFTFSLFSCNNASFRDDVAVSTLSDTIEPLIANAAHLDTADDDYLRFNLDGTEIAAERVVRLSVSGQSLDEYGIFHAPDEASTAALSDACNAYLKQRNEAWMNEYLVEEYPKLRDAEVITMGNYVFYFILSDEEKDQVITALTEVLQ